MSGNMLDGLAHPEFNETIDRYTPQQDLREVVEGLAPSGWYFERNAVWFGCSPPPDTATPLPSQGWKIHVSAATHQAEDLLRAVVPVLTARQVAFKFALDSRMLSFMNSKQWARAGSGKFITVYPRNDEEFLSLIEDLYQATRRFDGPYVLSDRRYKDSRVIYYRYGGLVPQPVVNVRGEMQQMLVAPSGELVPDRRVPYFVMPPWVRDPFRDDGAAAPGAPSSDIPLKDGRYVVNSILRYSNAGGIYIATDTTDGQTVVIKEARPMVMATEDATILLQKEYRLLSKVAHLRVAPQPIDLFQDWEHWFLVQERINGQDLMSFGARYNVTLKADATREDTALYYQQFKQVFRQLAEILAVLHEHGIIFADLSPSNLIIDPETMKLTIIDFEAAFEQGVDAPVPLFTEGFAFIDQANGRPSTVQSDYFAMGAIMHNMLWPVNPIFMISPRSRHTFIASVVEDIGFPSSIRDMVSGLLDRDAEKRPTPSEVMSVLARDEEVSAPWTTLDAWSPDDDAITSLLRGMVDDAVRYLWSVADYERRDRLFPADGAVFRTNPLSVAYGASGIAYVVHRLTGDATPIVDWMRTIPIDRERYAPGLFRGLAGIGWTLADLGLVEPAQKVMRMAATHPLRDEAVDVFGGMAGCGLASLRLFAAARDEEFLQQAIDTGRHLLRTRTDVDAGCYWSEDANDIPLGFAHGASGIALFLLYLALASGDDEFLEVGRRALAFDLSHALNSDAGSSWPRSTGRPSIIYPYWQYGSAGIGTTMLRYDRVLGGRAEYRHMLDRMFVDTNRKYAIFPCRFKGLAGLGEFLLDAYAFTGERRFLQGAYRVASGIALFRVERQAGLAFPGEMLRRISCDFATGSAGVAHFLHRLTHRDLPPAFMLDDQFPLTGAATMAVAGGEVTRAAV